MLTFQATLTFQVLLTVLQCSSYAIITKGTLSILSKVTLKFHTQLRLRSKIPSYAYVPRCAYVPKDKVTFQATQLLSYAYTIQDTFRFQLRYNQKVRFQSRVKLGLRFKICIYAYVSKYILTRTL